MSYSFTVTAKTKAEAKLAVDDALDDVIARQPIHARDKGAAMSAAAAVIDLVVEDPAYSIQVNVNGYVGWREVLRDDVSNDLTAASVGASASLFKVPE